MLRPVSSVLVLVTLLFAMTRVALADEQRANIRVDVADSKGTINPFIYGQFLEHIAHSTDLGLHAEMLTQRSFEYRGAPYVTPELDGVTLIGKMWEEAEGKMISSHVGGLAALLVGESESRDYVFETRVRKMRHSGGVWVLIRHSHLQAGYLWEVTGSANGNSTLSSRKDGFTTDLDQTPISSDPGQWVDARVEVQGDHIVCTLNGKVVHDLRNSDHAMGRTGVGFLVAPGEVAEMKMSSIAGETLYQSRFSTQPPDVHMNDVGKGWEAVGLGPGNATALRVTDDPLNSQYSLRLNLTDAAGQSAGVQQTNVPAQAKARYNGYVYLRGRDFSGQGRVVWRSADGANTYAEAPLAGAGEKWQKASFSLSPDTTDPNASVAFLFEGQGTVWLDQASLVLAHLKPEAPFRKDLVDAIGDLKPTMIRYPGGCFASIYDWRDGIGPVDERPVMPIFDWSSVGGVDPNHFGTDEFIQLCRQVGAEPMLVTNLGLGPEVAAQWVEYCNGDVSTPMGALRKKNGYPEPHNVKYWSIDNEYWLADSRQYGRLARKSVEAMLRIDPDLEFWLVGCFRGNDAYVDGVLAEAGEYCDYLSIHYYGSGPYETAVASNLEMETWFNELDQRLKRLMPDKQIQLAFDEWNPGSTAFYFGLASAGFLNSMERFNHVVGMSAPALFLRNCALAKSWDNALIQFDQTRMYVSGTYLAMKMYAQNYAPLRVGVDVDCSGYKLEDREDLVPYLDVVATHDPDDGRVVLKVLNRHKDSPVKTAIEVQLPEGFELKTRGKVFTLNADVDYALNSLDKPDQMWIDEDTIVTRDTSFTHTFPAHTATVLILHAERR